MMDRGVRAARKMLRFVHVCIYIDAGEPVRSAHGIHKLTDDRGVGCNKIVDLVYY